jgi:iron complex outermembrane receptor protein
VRYDRYDDVGSTTNEKFGVSWVPTAGLAVRGSYGTSFRAPLISQIYGNSNNLFAQSYQNPAGGATIPGIAYSGPNPDLGPEKARTWSAGVDWDPIPELKLSLTYWDVLYRNQVETYLSNLAILARESEFAGTDVILRGTAARDRVLQLLAQGVTLAAGSFPGGSPNNVTLFVDGRNKNLGKSITRGIDFSGSWRLETGAAGRFTVAANGTYLTTYDLAIAGSAPLVDRLDTIFNPLRLKLRASLTWEGGPLLAQLAATHVGGYRNTAVTPAQGVSSYTPVDASLTWTAFHDLKVGVEVRNVFDEDPPYVNLAPSANGSGGYDATVANPIGRLFAVSLRKAW